MFFLRSRNPKLIANCSILKALAVGLKKESLECSARLADTPQAMQCSVLGGEETPVIFKHLLYCSEDNNSPNTLQAVEKDFCL